MDTYTKLKEENKKLNEQLDQHRECDPEVLEGVKKSGSIALEAANRWTDNVFAIKSWCSKKFNIQGRDIDKQFGIPEEFDYIEE